MIQLGDPPLNDVGECSTLGLRPRGEVAHQFGVEVSGLPAGAVKPPLKRDVRLSDDELTFDRHRPRQVEEEAFSRAVPADDKPNARPSLFDPLEIIEDCGNLVETTNLEVTQSYAGNNSRSQRLKDCVPFPRLDGNSS